jgi:hypothetical protein
MQNRGPKAHGHRILQLLAGGPKPSSFLANELGASQPTVSRALQAMRDQLVRIGEARSIQYAARDGSRGFGDASIYRVDGRGGVVPLGTLTPVRPDGYVFQESDRAERTQGPSTLYSEGLPWWLLDMRPQGFLGRAFVARHGAALGLPDALATWSDAQALRALLAHGHDAVGNLLLGDAARDVFLQASEPVPVPWAGRGLSYAQLSEEAARGESPGSSAGGEQPKFTAFAESHRAHPRHVLVKFTVRQDNAVTERWRDLLLAEHHALSALRDHGVDASQTEVVDHGGQRFLEVERFDRVGSRGRRALHSLAALDAEFIGAANLPWPDLTRRLAEAGHITPAAHEGASLLYAFGILIGNTDMHLGNLSFISESGRPYQLAPAYDMLPMGFSPRSSGSLPAELIAPVLRSHVANPAWHQALAMALDWLARLRAESRLSEAFEPCMVALERHLAAAGAQAARLG